MDGRNIIGYEYVPAGTTAFKAVNPLSDSLLEGDFYPAVAADVDRAVLKADEAFRLYRKMDKSRKAAFLRSIGEEIIALGPELIERACAESGLPEARILGERGRTTAQLNLFADLVEEGSWVEAVIDSALPERQPVPRPDIRRMLVPLGPVVVFGASNFPLAFSVAGGDTASALAAGCPVIVKAHPAHPGTSALVGQAIVKAAKDHGLPEGVFSLLFDQGYEIGAGLVKHPKVTAVAFTGSFKGGMALIRLAGEREIPIPVFAEMGSINPVLLLPQALEKRAEEIAVQYAGSISMGAGQFCTNPGLLLALKGAGLDRFKEKLIETAAGLPASTMLTSGIFKHFSAGTEKTLKEQGVQLLVQAGDADAGKANQARTVIAQVQAQHFLNNPALKEEVFGPWSLLVVADTQTELLQVLKAAGGQLTLSVMAEASELEAYPDLLDLALLQAGRVLMNGVPTGVEVCAAMQHGGPFPASSDSRFTSVGSMAIKRFVRPLSWQNWPVLLLPDELKIGNPLGIWRIVNNQMTK